MFRSGRGRIAAGVWLCALSWCSNAEAADAANESTPPADARPVQLEPVEVKDKPWLFNRETRYSHLLPEVDGTQITVTKKATVEKLDQQPTVIDNNQRELFVRVPGVVIAEQQNPLQLNLNYRGIGNPQESEYVLSLQDGIPIPLDWIGYPTQYYLPIPQTIDSIQLVRGGSGLLYGPQPQPVIQYISVAPNPDRAFSGTTEQVGGSDGLFSSFNRVSGTTHGLGYLADYAHRESSGQRDNGDYDVNAGDLRLSYAIGSHQKIGFDFHAYSVESGLPGFLTINQFKANAGQGTTPLDREWTDRYTGLITYENKFSERGLVVAKLWTGTTELTTRADTYAASGTATAATLTQQRFYYTGLDLRLLQRWARGNAFSIGVTGYNSRSPWTVYNTPNTNVGQNDHSGTLNYYNDSTTKYGAIFAENVFRFGRFHVVPSARFEHEEIGVQEKTASAAHTGPLVNGTTYKNVPLFGIGLGNDFGHGNETYLNIAQGWRPVRYRDIASNTSRLAGSNAPDPTKYVTYEAGVHGWPRTGLFYDISVFQVNTKNRIESQSSGVNQTVNVNSGNARSRGIEAELDYDVLRLFPSVSQGMHLTTFVNASLLNAKIVQSTTLENGPGSPTLADNTPAYAPHYVVKSGVTWRQDGLFKLSLTEQTTGSQYWNDSNQARVAGGVVTSPARLPQYTVVDLSGEYLFLPHVRLLGGVYNLTDRTYYSRVFFANAGIEPANGRTFNAGVAIDF